MRYPHICGTVDAVQRQPTLIPLSTGIGCPEFLRSFEDMPPPPTTTNLEYPYAHSDIAVGFLRPLGSLAAVALLCSEIYIQQISEYKFKHQSLPILEQMLETLQTIRDRRMLWSEDIVSLNKKISELSSQNQTLAFLKQNGLVDPDIFIAKSNELTRQLRQAKLDKEELMDAEGDATAQRTRELIALLEDGPDSLDHPDTELCGALVAEIIVESNDALRFRLHNGLELRESIERTVR